VPRMRPSQDDARIERRSCVSVRDTEYESDDGVCVVMSKIVTRKLLDPEAGEFVLAAMDHASKETSGDMDTPEHNFEMELVDEEREKKTDVSNEESDEVVLDEDRNWESQLSDEQLGERELGENEEIRETSDRPPKNRVRLLSQAGYKRPKRETRNKRQC